MVLFFSLIITTFNWEAFPNDGMFYLTIIVDLVDQQGNSTIRDIVTAVSLKYHILLTVVHLLCKMPIVITSSLDKITILARERPGEKPRERHGERATRRKAPRVAWQEGNGISSAQEDCAVLAI
jgi:hypothetical protein